MKRTTLALSALLFALPGASQASENHNNFGCDVMGNCRGASQAIEEEFDIEIPDEAAEQIEALVGCNMVGAAETASLMGLLALGLPLLLRRREER